MTDKILPYGRQVIEADDEVAVLEVLRSEFLTTGPKVPEFEKAFSQICDGAETIACSNGTTALQLACLAMGIGEGDSVIVPSMTFLATANAVRYCGADVVFADCDPETGLMQPHHAEEALARARKPVKAIFCVHLGGQVCDLKALSQLAKETGLYLLADSCHAIGGDAGGYPVGACQYEDIATFSFHPVKTIATGEGGAVTTRHESWAKRLRIIRSHAMEKDKGPDLWSCEMNQLGYNFRLSDIHAALGISQLAKLPAFLKRRREIADMYDDLLAPLAPVIKPPLRQEKRPDPAWHLYALRVDFDALGMGRNAFMQALRDRGVGSQVHYIPVHSQPYYQGLASQPKLPGTEHYYARTLSIPLYPSLADDDVKHVANVIADICRCQEAA